MRSIECWVMTLTFASFALALPAGAATFTVDTTADDPSLSACDDAVANDCSLRGAMSRANGLAESSLILVPTGVYSLTNASSCHLVTHQRGVFNLNTVSLCFAGNITLVGTGAGTTIIDGNHAHRVAYVSDGFTVEIRSVTLRNGLGVTDHDPYAPGFLTSVGGAVDNSGDVSLIDSRIEGSTTPSDGGAIYNDNAVTLIRSQLVGNTAAGAGGAVANESFYALTALTIKDSSIASNQAVTSLGGGVFNFGGIVSVAGSTISGNLAPGGLGGGLYNGNNSAAMEIVNSTISGNSSGSSGGGIENGSPNAVVLNNVTITNNVGATDGRGTTGGIDGGPFVLSNTIVAGNRDARGGTPDCNTHVTSRGYNLIKETTSQFMGFTGVNCIISGDSTGNILGQDALLGVLADNGGVTQTHALAVNSPAIDAGSPATPGSGAPACAVADQRGLLRPLGVRCDIGAFERNGAFALTSVTPSTAGNTGSAMVSVAGSGFVQGATLALKRAGQPDIVVTPQVDVGGSDLIASVDLGGAAPGSFDVVVTNPDQSVRTLASAFTVHAGGGPKLWVDVIGMLRRHGPSFVTVLYGNRGDVDALAVPLTISVPDGYQATARFDVNPPETQAGEIRPNWSDSPIVIAEPTTTLLNVPLIVPVVPSGYTGALRFTLALTPTSAPSLVVAVIGTPAYTDMANPSFVASAALGAQSHLQQVFGFVVPATALPELQQYAANELQRIVAAGRATFAASIGMDPSVYSLAQFQVDLAFHAAQRAAGQ